MTIQIRKSFNNVTETDKFETNRLILGRFPTPNADEYDLGPDTMVSRHHARITREEVNENCCYWIEDIGSRYGTFINDEELPRHTPRQIYPSDLVRIGPNTTIEIVFEQTPFAVSGDTHVITSILPGATPTEIFFHESQMDAATLRHHLEMVDSFSQVLASETTVEGMLYKLLEYSREAIKAVESCGILVLNASGELHSLYSLPEGMDVRFTRALALNALQDRKTLVLGPQVDATVSMNQHKILSGVYAPLDWQERKFGLLYVNNHSAKEAFNIDDARLLRALSLQASMFIYFQHVQRIQANLIRHFSPQVAARLLRRENDLRLGGEPVSEATVLVSDIRGFTAMTQGMAPDDVMQMLNLVFSELTPILFKYHGTLDKYIGDGILAVFGSPEPDADHCIHAVSAALEMQYTVGQLSAHLEAQFGVRPQIGIGIHCGPIVHGYLGSNDRLEYTIIGDTVNKASRACDKAKRGQIVLSNTVYQAVADQVVVESESFPILKHQDEIPLVGYILTGLS
jgi:adenylate cyclase